MTYTELFKQLKTAFAQNTAGVLMPGSSISFQQLRFVSQAPDNLFDEPDASGFHENGVQNVPDEKIVENIEFTYPVFIPEQSAGARPIILLHGLNERSWTKYLAWAYYLAENTRRPVIMFPIAFHMNRSPEAWSDPRQLSGALALRRQSQHNDPSASLANIALSNRLTENPLRFFSSGRQSAGDLEILLKQLHQGEHPLFPQGTTADVFAYSIGAFLAQIMFLANPEGLLSHSKLFLFCGGAMFDQMNGTSKLIMDKPAFDSLRKYYILEFEKEAKKHSELNEIIHRTQIGRAFVSMLSKRKMRRFRKKRFKQMREQLQAVALRRDKVIPARDIRKALGRKARLEILDFPYDYTHETPFPILTNGSAGLVDNCFELIFGKAAAFLR